MGETKRLYLLRHAKSSWDDPSLADHDRPLAPRGRRAAARIGAYLRDEQIRVDVVLCSSARRARETCDVLAPPGQISIEPELYHASASDLLARVRHLPEDLDAVMLIGHEPAIRELAVDLVGPDSALAERKYPTGALAALTFTGPWSALRPGRAELASFVSPRELAD